MKPPFTKASHIICCLPTLKHCSKGVDASASVSMIDLMAVSEGIKSLVEVWDQIERKMYVLDAKAVEKKLYHCGSADFMAFKYKQVNPLEIRCH